MMCGRDQQGSVGMTSAAKQELCQGLAGRARTAAQQDEGQQKGAAPRKCSKETLHLQGQRLQSSVGADKSIINKLL